MSSSQRTPAQASTQKRPREEETDTISLLSDHNSREFDDVTLAREDPHHQIDTPKAKRKKLREDEELWSYALSEPPSGQPDRGNSNQEIFYCKQCSKDNTSATTFRRHLKNKHGILCIAKKAKADVNNEATLAALFAKQRELDDTGKDPKVTRILKEAVSEKDFLDSLCSLIVTHDLPHSIVEWPEFRAFLHVCNYTLVSKDGLLAKWRNSVPLLLGKTFVVHKDLIRKKLSTALSKLHFTIDCWAAPNKTAFQAVTVHFVNEAGQLSTATLALREHKESQGGEQQAEVLIKVLEEYEIDKKQIGYIADIGDNHGSNDKLCRILQKRFPSWTSVHHRIRCIGHVINLAIQAFPFIKDKEAVKPAVQAAEEFQAREQRFCIESKHEYDQDEATQVECLKSWLRQIVKSGGFATVDVAVEAINLEESIDKTTSGDAGRNTVSNKEANKAVGG